MTKEPIKKIRQNNQSSHLGGQPPLQETVLKQMVEEIRFSDGSKV